MKTAIAVNGACGRMGKRIVQLAHEDAGLKLVAALDNAAHPDHGKDIGEVCGLGPIGVNVAQAIAPNTNVEAVIDFSVPEGTFGVLNTCVERGIPLVVATTGFSAAERA